MVQRSRRFPTTLLCVPGVLLLAGGCGLVPQGQLDECRRRSQTLQAENARLKDVTLTLRTQNDDLTTRAVADARRLTLQDEALQRLESSVQAYQGERDQLAGTFERLKGRIHSSAGPLSSALGERLLEFARARPGCEFDAQTDVMAFTTTDLFEPGTETFRTGARALLQSFADLVNDPEARTLRLSVAGPAQEDTVRRARVESDSALGRARASRVRDWLASEGKVEAARVRVAATESPSAGPRRIEVRLRPPAVAALP